MKFTVKQARSYAGLTQEAMAKRLGIDRSTYIRLEKDVSRATVGQINLISKITGVPVLHIILFENSTLVEKESGKNRTSNEITRDSLSHKGQEGDRA